MRSPVGWFWNALILLGCIGYQLLVHLAVNEDRSAPLRIALLSLPLLVLAYWAVVHSSRRLLWLPVILGVGAGIYLLERQQPLSTAAIYGIPHAAAYCFLLWFFGRTLERGKEPLVTRLARRVHGSLPPYMEAYTRGVTVAWCVFFAVQLASSALLFTFTSLHTWSLFINILNFPLVALMFTGEYLYRVRRYRNYPHASFAKSMQAFAKDASLSGNAKAR
jgi:uncharacterized membrane protein